MIDKYEQKMLINLASEINLNKGNIVELGTFFGKSTACLINGILKNQTYKNNISLFSYDKFFADKNSIFGHYVIQHAKKANLYNALEFKKNFIYFENIFSFFTAGYENKVLKTHSVEINKMKEFKKKIILLFIDSPKSFLDTKKVLECFFDKVIYNGIIIFQDFFYHLSAEYIAIVTLLLKLKKIEIISTCATSLIVKKIDNISKKDLKINLLKLQKKKNFYLEIDEIKYLLKNVKIDRHPLFYPRLIVAQIQNCFKEKKYNTLSIYTKELTSNNYLSSSVTLDLLDLINHKFLIKK